MQVLDKVTMQVLDKELRCLESVVEQLTWSDALVVACGADHAYFLPHTYVQVAPELQVSLMQTVLCLLTFL